ncbi:MAG: MBL fold metallo-hydrolase [Hyphomicrobiaceae bacterium]
MSMKSDGQVNVSRRGLLAGTAAAGLAATTGGVLLPTTSQAKAPFVKTQAPYFYRFNIGAFEATIVSDGPLPLGDPGKTFIPTQDDNIPQLLENHFLPKDNVVLEQNILVLNTGSKLVLFDTGMGDYDMFGPTTGKLGNSLKSAGIDPAAIDAVVISHAHPDHLWGLMKQDGTVNFPNAQVYISQTDHDFWTGDAQLNGEGFIKLNAETTVKQLAPYKDKLVFVKDGEEFLPGIQAIATPGHSPGHTSFMITSEGKSFCNLADVSHHYVLLFETPWVEFAYDIDAKQAAASRMKTLDMLASEKIPFVSFHFPWPGIGYAGRHGKGYHYHPKAMNLAL